MLEDFTLFWNQEKVREIIQRDNSIKKSFIELLIATIISLCITGVFFFLNTFVLKKTTVSLVDKISSLISLLLICLNLYVWVYSLLVSLVLKKLTVGMPSSQKDAHADMMIIINRLEQNTINLVSILFSIAMISFSLFGKEEPASISILLIFALFLVVIIMSPIMFLLSLRMQAIALEMLYSIPMAKAVGYAIAANFILIFCIDFIFSALSSVAHLI